MARLSLVLRGGGTSLRPHTGAEPSPAPASPRAEQPPVFTGPLLVFGRPLALDCPQQVWGGGRRKQESAAYIAQRVSGSCCCLKELNFKEYHVKPEALWGAMSQQAACSLLLLQLLCKTCARVCSSSQSPLSGSN